MCIKPHKAAVWWNVTVKEDIGEYYEQAGWRATRKMELEVQHVDMTMAKIQARARRDARQNR
jgi:hypothetical protein